MRTGAWLLCAAVAGWAGLLCATVRADNIVYNVTLNTAPLEVPGTFYLDFAMYGGNGQNNVTISNFSFGNGGSATGSANYVVPGDASGDLYSSISLDTFNPNYPDNEVYQTFTAGDSLSFTVTSSNVEAPVNTTPDVFAFFIDDATTNAFQTTGLYSELMSLTYNNPGGDPTLSTYPSTDAYSDVSLGAPVAQLASAVPLPSIWAMGLVLTPMLALALWWHRRRGSAIHKDV